MKITLDKDGRRLVARQPYENADRVVVDSAVCPSCKLAPLAVRGRGASRDAESPHDTRRADATCVGCDAPAGVLRVQLSTLFGVDEDERVLHGPWRVY